MLINTALLICKSTHRNRIWLSSSLGGNYGRGGSIYRIHAVMYAAHAESRQQNFNLFFPFSENNGFGAKSKFPVRPAGIQ